MEMETPQKVASLSALSPSRPPNKVAITQLDPNANIRAAIKAFVRDHLYIAEDIQRLTAPLFSKVSDGECIEDVYSRYACHVDLDVTNLHLDEDTFCVYGLEGSQTVTLSDSDSLHDRHILDKSTLYLHALPRSLPPQGGRIYVETKEGVLPLTGIRPTTTVRAVKELLSKLTLIPICRQMLYSIGRVMHDEMMVRDFEGLHAVHVDSVLDMCVSGDSSREQTHKRIVVKVQSDQSFGGCIESSATTSTSGSCTSSSPFSSSSSFAAAEPLLVVCQGRDTVRELMAVIETRAGIPMSGKRLRFGGKLLDKDKSLADYFVQQECMLHIVPSGSPFKPTRLALPEPIYADDSPVGKVVAASRRAGESGGVGGEGSAGGRARSPAAAGGIYGAGRERDEEAEDGEEAFVIKKTPPAARKIKMMRTSNAKDTPSIKAIDGEDVQLGWGGESVRETG
ncbi:hypothetical protein CBR_g5724 [Chara braunii]|uniref:Ubiquitin-like domain-containing protein n=1 Tax=Chara braunii TaxID=69332 RepID=A0A388KJ66_CHABU|nr:hypothetical protein CBR_g5724 [Chara braunii]|eukprot:GBG70092.1 hypothetical protein CBR_g5724 [Chara braunii]